VQIGLEETNLEVSSLYHILDKKQLLRKLSVFR